MLNRFCVVLVIALVALSTIVVTQQSREDGRRLIKVADNDAGAWMTPAQIDALAQANIGFMDVTDHLVEPSTAPPTPPPLPNQPQQKQYVRSLLSKLEVSNIKANVETLSSFYTRYYSTETGLEAAQWIYSTLRAYAGSRKDISVEYFEHPWLQPSVIARIEGAVSSDIVILGAHEDSINKGALGQAPGVDDDGSGSTCVLEVFRTLVSNNFKPNRTVEFHFYAAEEVGLKGSQAIAESYYQQNKVVVGMMQLDMTFWVGKRDEVGVVVDFVNANLTQFTRELVDSYSNIPWVDTACGYGCSDHASWNKYGYRSTFPFESRFSDSNPYIHSTQDTLAHANLNHGLEFAKIGLGHVVELAATQYQS